MATLKTESVLLNPLGTAVNEVVSTIVLRAYDLISFITHVAAEENILSFIREDDPIKILIAGDKGGKSTKIYFNLCPQAKNYLPYFAMFFAFSLLLMTGIILLKFFCPIKLFLNYFVPQIPKYWAENLKFFWGGH